MFAWRDVKVLGMLTDGRSSLHLSAVYADVVGAFTVYFLPIVKS